MPTHLAHAKTITAKKERAQRRECRWAFVYPITDALRHYITAIEAAFGYQSVDYGQIVKTYAASRLGGDKGRYSPPVCVASGKSRVFGNPDRKHVSTSYIERANLSMRMNMRRFTRLTNGFSKKIENHAHAQALYFMAYNFCRAHGTLTKAAKGVHTTPAMAAGLASHVWTMEEVLAMVEQRAAA